MLSQIIRPRYCETDALGHINNCSLAPWFESGRLDIFRAVHPDMAQGEWQLILRRTEYEFLRQIYVEHEVELRTGISRIGSTSFEITHEAWQQGEQCASGIALMVWFDFALGKPQPIPADTRLLLSTMLIKAPAQDRGA